MADDTKTEAKPLTEFTVTAGAVTFRTGTGVNDVARFFKGQRLRLDAEQQRVKDFVQMGVLQKKEKDVKLVAATVRGTAALLGAGDDPATPPDVDDVPLAPSMEPAATLPNSEVAPSA
jgi:hypothetical protein